MGLVSEGLPALKDAQMSKKLIIFPNKKHHLKIEALKHVYLMPIKLKTIAPSFMKTDSLARDHVGGSETIYDYPGQHA